MGKMSQTKDFGPDLLPSSTRSSPRAPKSFNHDLNQYNTSSETLEWRHACHHRGNCLKMSERCTRKQTARNLSKQQHHKLHGDCAAKPACAIWSNSSVPVLNLFSDAKPSLGPYLSWFTGSTAPVELNQILTRDLSIHAPKSTSMIPIPTNTNSNDKWVWNSFRIFFLTGLGFFFGFLGWYHLPSVCNGLELEFVILHGICNTWACSPSILHGISYMWACSPKYLQLRKLGIR